MTYLYAVLVTNLQLIAGEPHGQRPPKAMINMFDHDASWPKSLLVYSFGAYTHLHKGMRFLPPFSRVLGSSTPQKLHKFIQSDHESPLHDQQSPAFVSTYQRGKITPCFARSVPSC